MALIAAALIGTAISTGVQVSNNRKRRNAEADAAEREANFLESQAARTLKASERQLELLSLERSETLGDQITTIAANNIDLSGSALFEIGQTNLNFDAQGKAIEEETNFEVSITRLRAQEARLGASRIKKSGGMADFATILGGGTQAVGIASKFTGSGTGDKRTEDKKK